MMQQAIAKTIKSLALLMVAAALMIAAGLMFSRAHGQIVLSVKTGSMRPAIKPGDAVLVRQRPGGLWAGDIISYRSLQNPKATITHRIVSIDNSRGQIITKGDALDIADPPFDADRVIGKVEGVIPMAGYGLNVLRRPAGLAAVVYLPAVILTYGEIRRLVRHYNSQRYYLGVALGR